MRPLPFLVLLALGASAPAPVGITTRPVQLDADDPARTSVGRLRWLGGVEISSGDRRVGGISGMRFAPDGRLRAVTDAGDWLWLRLLERDGRLTGVADVGVARQAGRDGRPLRGKADADAEALEFDTDGTPYVAYEREHRVMRFPADGERARPVAFPDSGWLGRLPSNEGLEAIARVGSAWLFIAEGASADGYNGILQARGGPNPAYGRVTLRMGDGFKPTDAHALGDTHVLVLARRYSPMLGVAARLAIVAIDRERLTLGEPELIAELAAPVTVDNMEAVAVRAAGGRTFIYVASDDNFSPLQRTLLLKFELLPR